MGGKGGLSLTVEHQSINVVTVVEKSPFYNHHSKEWFSKKHLLIINVQGESDGHRFLAWSESLIDAYELKRKTP